MLAKEFRCECTQTQPTFAVLNTITRWAMFRATFGLKEIEKFMSLGKIRARLKLQLQKIGKRSKAK